MVVQSILGTTGCHHSSYSFKYRCADCGNILSTDLEAFHIDISTSEGNKTSSIFVSCHLIVCIFSNITACTIQLSWPQKVKWNSVPKEKIFYWTNKGQLCYETYFVRLLPFWGTDLFLCVFCITNMSFHYKSNPLLLLHTSEKLPQVGEKLIGCSFVSYITKRIIVLFLLLILYIYVLYIYIQLCFCNLI